MDGAELAEFGRRTSWWSKERIRPFASHATVELETCADRQFDVINDCATERTNGFPSHDNGESIEVHHHVTRAELALDFDAVLGRRRVFQSEKNSKEVSLVTVLLQLGTCRLDRGKRQLNRLIIGR